MYLLFDIGATKTRVAYSADGKTLGSPRIIPTQKDFTWGGLILDMIEEDNR